MIKRLHTVKNIKRLLKILSQVRKEQNRSKTITYQTKQQSCMKKTLKIGVIAVTFIVLLIVGGMLYLTYAIPNVGAPSDLKIVITPEKIEKGKYLAHHVLQCIDCHSQRDFSLFSAPPSLGTEAHGGERFDQSMGFPGVFISPNITPYGIGDWTDGELFRLITTGVKKNGDPIFPIMPYKNYGQLDQEDIEAVIAYVRTLDPAPTLQPPSNPDFPFNFIMRTMPEKANLSKRPSTSDQVAYGKYLVTAGACNDCHTNFENGAFIGEFLAGGRVFELPNGTLTSTNITPHETGIGSWNEKMFIDKFKSYQDRATLARVDNNDFQTIMPWYMYSGMTEEDLTAIYVYLRSIPPIESRVERFKPRS